MENATAFQTATPPPNESIILVNETTPHIQYFNFRSFATHHLFRFHRNPPPLRVRMFTIDLCDYLCGA